MTDDYTTAKRGWEYLSLQANLSTARVELEALKDRLLACKAALTELREEMNDRADGETDVPISGTTLAQCMAALAKLEGR